MKKKNQMESDDFFLNLNRALRFLSFRPRSEKEIRDYFKIKSQKTKTKINQETIELIILKLKKQKFIDDTEFVRWWIDQRERLKPRSLKFIKFELKKKGISNELIENSELGTVSDFEKAFNLAKKRIGRYKNEESQKVYEKMGRFLASKGFDYDVIKKVIEKVLPKGYNE